MFPRSIEIECAPERMFVAFLSPGLSFVSRFITGEDVDRTLLRFRVDLQRESPFQQAPQHAFVS
jgi:hypothetical protein